MKYIGNIGHLLNSVYVRDKLPNSRKKRVFGKKTSKKYAKVIKLVEDKTIDNISINSKLLEIRSFIDLENKNKGRQTEIKEGFVYIVVNPIFPDWVKIGMTTDYEKRLQNYNTCDPFTNFSMKYIKWVSDRRNAENILLHVLKFKSEESKGEWFKINETTAKEIIDSLVL